MMAEKQEVEMEILWGGRAEKWEPQQREPQTPAAAVAIIYFIFLLQI